MCGSLVLLYLISRYRFARPSGSSSCAPVGAQAEKPNVWEVAFWANEVLTFPQLPSRLAAKMYNNSLTTIYYTTSEPSVDNFYEN